MTEAQDEKKGAGRPEIVLTEKQRADLELLAPYLTLEQIADHMGISQSTFQRIKKRDPEILTIYKRGKAKMIAKVSQGLIQKALAGCKTREIFVLKTQGGWKETTVNEHTGPNGGPLTSIVGSAALSGEDYQAAKAQFFGVKDDDPIPDFDTPIEELEEAAGDTETD